MILKNDLQLLKLNENDLILLIKNEIFWVSNSLIMFIDFLNDMQLLKLNENDRILLTEIEKFYLINSLTKLEVSLNDMDKYI